MRWTAPATKDTASATLEKRLREADDELRANSGLTSAQCSQPVSFGRLIAALLADIAIAVVPLLAAYLGVMAIIGPGGGTGIRTEGVLFYVFGALWLVLLALTQAGLMASRGRT